MLESCYQLIIGGLNATIFIGNRMWITSRENNLSSYRGDEKGMGRRYTEREKNIIRDNYLLMEYKDLAELLPNRTLSSIMATARYYGYEKGPYSIYSVNQAYFSDPTAENSYWAGFIAADGSINKTRLDRLQIDLSVKDEEHLYLFKEACGYTGPIRNYREDYFPYSRLLVCGVDQWVKDLKSNFRVTSNKSKFLEFPRLNDMSLLLAYIAGLIDGDGSITYQATTRSYTPYIKINAIEPLISSIKDFFDNSYPNKRPSKVSEDRSSSNLKRYVLGGKRALDVAKDIENLQLPLLRDRKSVV